MVRTDTHSPDAGVRDVFRSPVTWFLRHQPSIPQIRGDAPFTVSRVLQSESVALRHDTIQRLLETVGPIPGSPRLPFEIAGTQLAFAVTAFGRQLFGTLAGFEVLDASKQLVGLVTDRRDLLGVFVVFVEVDIGVVWHGKKSPVVVIPTERFGRCYRRFESDEAVLPILSVREGFHFHLGGIDRLIRLFNSLLGFGVADRERILQVLVDEKDLRRVGIARP